MQLIIKAAVFFAAVVLTMPPLLSAQLIGNDDFEKRKSLAIAALNNYTAKDTNRVVALLKIVNTAVYSKEKKLLLPYLDEAMQLSNRLNYKTGLGNCYLQKASYFKSLSSYPTALSYYDSALHIAGDQPGMQAIKQRALEQKGVIYLIQENYYPALDYFFESLKLLKDSTSEIHIRITTFIAEIYTTLKNLDKAAEYAKMNVTAVEKDSNIKTSGSVYFTYINICLEKGDLETAAFYLDKMSKWIPHPTEVQQNFGYFLKRGRISYLQQHYAEAYAYFKQTYKYALEGGHDVSKSTALYFLSATALQLGNKEEAKNYAVQDLALAKNMHSKSKQADALTNLSNYYSNTGNYAKANELLQQVIVLKDSIKLENNIKQLNVLGALYESGRQQQQITQLQSEKEKQASAVKQKSFLNKVFLLSIFALLLLGYLGYTNFKKGQQLSKQWQSLQHQKILELEKNKQLLTADAMIKGQEEERSRIAKELHDGLGSLLSGTKLSFINLKDNLQLSHEAESQFNRSLSLLDNTIGDLRKIAQNLMPEALVKFGLQEALMDFCAAVKFSSGLHVHCQQFGEIRKLDNNAAIYIYRIIQELVNNAIKHSDAAEVMIQVSMTENKTMIAVEDDGKGFDKNVLSLNKGAGMANINYRVQYFNGRMDIQSSPGKGTSVNIELNV